MITNLPIDFVVANELELGRVLGLLGSEESQAVHFNRFRVITQEPSAREVETDRGLISPKG